MPAVIACPQCQTKYQIPDNVLGKQIKCKSCGVAFPAKVPVATAQVANRPAASQPTARQNPGRPQPSAAEFAKLGLDGPLRRQPDVFAGVAPLPRQAPDMLGNHAADPGFADIAMPNQEGEAQSGRPDELAEIFQNPYLSPSAGKGKSRYAGDSNYKYGSLKIFAILISIGVAIHCVLSLTGTAVVTLFMPSQEAIKSASSDAMASSVLYFVGLLFVFLVATIAVYVFNVIMICMFMYRANANVRALGASDLSISPGWSAGWWFIPFMNLFKPAQAMMEIYQASVRPRGNSWKKLGQSGIVNGWWICFLLGGILSNIAGRLGEDGGEVLSMSLFWAASVLITLSGILLIMIVFAIDKNQKANAG